MDKPAVPNITNPEPSQPIKFPTMDAKKMSFDNASGSPPYEFKNSPPISSFFSGRKNDNKMENDPLTNMSQATRRDSLKGMHCLSDFSTE